MSDEENSNTIDVFSNGLLLVKTLSRSAEKISDRPEKGNIVTVDLTGRIKDTDQVIEDRTNFKFTIGASCDVVTGLDCGINLMSRGDTAEISIDAKYAYRDLTWYDDNDIVIPPNSNLIYTVKLIDFEPLPDNVPVERAPEILHFAEYKRTRGNKYFTAGEYGLCINLYRGASALLESFSDIYSDEYIKCLNNLAAAQIKCNLFKEAKENLLKSMDLPAGNNCKNMFRLATCHENLGNLDQAVITAKKAVELDPTNKTVKNYLDKLNCKLTDQNKKMASAYSKLFTDKNKIVPVENNVEKGTNLFKKNYKNHFYIAGAGVLLAGLAYLVNKI